MSFAFYGPISFMDQVVREIFSAQSLKIFYNPSDPVLISDRKAVKGQNLDKPVQDLKRQSDMAVAVDTTYLTELLVKVSEERDRDAFACLFEHYAPRVKSYVFRLGSDELMSEELAQQTMLQVWRKAHLFDPAKAAASTWIFRIARNLRLDHYRKERHFDYDEQDLSLIEDDSDSPETEMDRNQHASIVRNALQRLPQEQMEIIRLSFYEGLSHGEISEKLTVPLGTVKSRMRLAFKKIRQSLGDAL